MMYIYHSISSTPSVLVLINDKKVGSAKQSFYVKLSQRLAPLFEEMRFRCVFISRQIIECDDNYKQLKLFTWN